MAVKIVQPKEPSTDVEVEVREKNGEVYLVVNGVVLVALKEKFRSVYHVIEVYDQQYMGSQRPERVFVGVIEHMTRTRP
jgi:hypothetical protein